MSNSSFINGLVAGAGIALALMSYGFLLYIAPVENQQGVSSTEIRVAIMLGGLVAAASIGYEYYLNKIESKSTKQDTDKTKADSEKVTQEAEDAEKKVIVKDTATTESDSNKESQQDDSQETDANDETR